MSAAASYDVGCFELAVAFILDEPDVELAHAGPLAARIQRTIEEYLSEVRDNAESKRAFDAAKAAGGLTQERAFDEHWSSKAVKP